MAQTVKHSEYGIDTAVPSDWNCCSRGKVVDQEGRGAHGRLSGACTHVTPLSRSRHWISTELLVV